MWRIAAHARTDDIFSVGCCGTATASDRTAPILSDLQQFDLLRDCRFPPPWIVEEHNNACFIVRDATGQALGYFYFEEEPRRHSATKLLTRDEGRP